MKTGFIVCSSYSRELKFVIEKLKLTDIEISVIPSTCGNSTADERAFFSRHKEELQKHVQHTNILMSSNCTHCERKSSENSHQHFVCPSFCLENLVPVQLLNHFIENKSYIITIGWLLQWEHTIIHRWKFTKEIATQFFNDVAKQVLIIDTGVYGDFQKQLIEFTEYVGLKYSILPIGIDFFEKNIESILYKHHQHRISVEYAKYKKEVSQKLSEYAMTFDLIPSLSKIISEKKVIEKIIELYTILFAPEKIAYLKIDEIGEATVVQSDFANHSKKQLLSICNFEGEYSITDDKQGFITKINYNGKMYGFIWAENILFPEHLTRYINLAISLVSFFGLLISNSRQFEELEHTKNCAEEGKIEFQSLSEKYKEMNQKLNAINQEYASLLEEQKQNIEEITVLNESLVEKNETLDELNATKDKFFSIIAHDLKNPFNSLLGFTRLLIKNAHKYTPEKVLEFAQMMNDTTKETYSLLENLLEWSRLQRGTLTPTFNTIKPSEVIHQAISLCKQMSNSKQIELQLDMLCDEHISADNEMLKTVLRNLLTNAIKFTNHSGRVCIETQKEGKNILFIVSDNGIGIEPEHIGTLFKIDSKLSKAGTANEKGTGLGLILCKEFIEKHNGKIWVESEMGKGSSFKFSIPRQPNEKEGYR